MALSQHASGIAVPRGAGASDALHTTALWGGQLDPFQDGAHIYIGQAEGGQGDIGVLDDRHMLTCAGSRSGKGVSSIVPTLLSYRGNVLVLDPKGENARITAPWRSQFSKVYVLDPFDLTGLPPHIKARFNPLLGLARTVEEIGLVSDGLVVQSSDKETHWDEAAGNLLGGIIAHCLGDADASLPRVHDLLAQSVKELTAALQGSKSKRARTAAHDFADKAEGERASVLSNARKQMKWCASRELRANLEASDFRLTDLQTDTVSIYLCLPANYLEIHKRWMRVFLNLAMHAMTQAKPQGRLPALFVLDEFPVLGYMSQMETAAGLMAGYGLKLWTVIQDIGQLQALYKDRWQTFVGNAGVLQFFGNTDAGTCEYVSKLLGETLLVQEQVSRSIQERDPNQKKLLQRAMLASASMQHQRLTVPLLRPDEVRYWFAREAGAQIVVVPHQLPIKCWRAPYYAHPRFQGRASP
jgi:type IV secretion system protein VirD4